MPITRKAFLEQLALLVTGVGLSMQMPLGRIGALTTTGVKIDPIKEAEDLFAYMRRKGGFDQAFYQQLIGAANMFKEGDFTIGVAAENEISRNRARLLLGSTALGAIRDHPIYEDEIGQLIESTTDAAVFDQMNTWTCNDLRTFLLSATEDEIKQKMTGLSSDLIGCVVRLMSNQELIQVSSKLFNPLPGSQIGAQGYLSARIQPNSPTDNIDDIMWQVFDGWSYSVGDLVLGTNPVSSEVESVARIEGALHDILVTFELESVMPNCVLSHIDVQAEVELMQPGTTGIWFQSLAGTVNANKTFDVSIEKMFEHAGKRNGAYGLYVETGQGADMTNGHAAGFDMVLHESRKYGFLRALKSHIGLDRLPSDQPWVHVNDVAGFIGPEVFKTREQLVRCCLEDTLMGKLHGLTIGLDICSTLHMDVTLDDLEWCINEVMPANPAYLMALPTRNDPMLSYLTTAFHDHLKVRHKFGYKVNDAMWEFFQRLEVIDKAGQPTEHFGDPVWVYLKYLMAKGDERPREEIYAEGKRKVQEIQNRGVPIAQGYGDNYWDPEPKLDREVRRLYADAKESLWTSVESTFVTAVVGSNVLQTNSKDRKDYVYHPETGERIAAQSITRLNNLRRRWAGAPPTVQILISDGLNFRAIHDDGHLQPFLGALRTELSSLGYDLGSTEVFIHNGRVRAGYHCGEILFSNLEDPRRPHGIVHVIGERPGSGHHNFSAYLTVATSSSWGKTDYIDHNISKVVSGISDTALAPDVAAFQVSMLLHEMFDHPA